MLGLLLSLRELGIGASAPVPFFLIGWTQELECSPCSHTYTHESHLRFDLGSLSLTSWYLCLFC
jgi:hypothetical protein